MTTLETCTGTLIRAVKHAQVQCQRASPGCGDDDAVNHEVAKTAPLTLLQEVQMISYASFPDRCRAKTGKGTPLFILRMCMSAVAADVHHTHVPYAYHPREPGRAFYSTAYALPARGSGM